MWCEGLGRAQEEEKGKNSQVAAGGCLGGGARGGGYGAKQARAGRWGGAFLASPSTSAPPSTTALSAADRLPSRSPHGGIRNNISLHRGHLPDHSAMVTYASGLVHPPNCYD